jgi:hypothetical protein
MNRIDIGLPKHISSDKVKMIIENFLKNNSDFRCEVHHINTVGDECRYMVEYNEPMALYFIGFAACGIEKAYPKPMTDEEKQKMLYELNTYQGWQVIPKPQLNITDSILARYTLDKYLLSEEEENLNLPKSALDYVQGRLLNNISNL